MATSYLEMVIDIIFCYLIACWGISHISTICLTLAPLSYAEVLKKIQEIPNHFEILFGKR